MNDFYNDPAVERLADNVPKVQVRSRLANRALHFLLPILPGIIQMVLAAYCRLQSIPDYLDTLQEYRALKNIAMLHQRSPDQTSVAWERSQTPIRVTPSSKASN